MTKIEMIKLLLEKGNEQGLYDLLVGTSAHNLDRQVVVVEPLPAIELTKLVGSVRDHLYFVSKYGKEKTHVIENGKHYFAYPEKFDEWIKLEAPGIHLEDLKSLCESVTSK